jgi:hypothetical protein
MGFHCFWGVGFGWFWGACSPGFESGFTGFLGLL